MNRENLSRQEMFVLVTFLAVIMLLGVMFEGGLLAFVLASFSTIFGFFSGITTRQEMNGANQK